MVVTDLELSTEDNYYYNTQFNQFAQNLLIL